MLRKTYDWVMSLAASKHAPRALAAMAFAEGLFFPIPPDVLLQPVGQWILSLTGGDFAAFQTWYAKYGAILIAVPIPYKITAIASGLGKLDFRVFIGVSILVRGLRFGGEALLLKIYGEPIRGFVEKRLALVASAAAVAIVGLVMALKFAL